MQGMPIVHSNGDFNRTLRVSSAVVTYIMLGSDLLELQTTSTQLTVTFPRYFRRAVVSKVVGWGYMNAGGYGEVRNTSNAICSGDGSTGDGYVITRTSNGDSNA